MAVPPEAPTLEVTCDMKFTLGAISEVCSEGPGHTVQHAAIDPIKRTQNMLSEDKRRVVVRSYIVPLARWHFSMNVFLPAQMM